MSLGKEVSTVGTPTAKQISNQVSLSKRALIKKGWVIPLVAGVSLPQSGFARNISVKPVPIPRPKPKK
jgi:hypothetical protein